MRESELCEATLTMDRLKGPAPPSRGPKPPKTADMGGLDFDVFADLLSFYVRTVNILVSQDLDARMEEFGLAGGTGKIATLLLVGANPGIRPSVLAHLVRQDRSAMGKLLDILGRAGLVEQRVSPKERRARELYLLPAGEALRARVRSGALGQDRDFFSMLDEGERTTLVVLLRKVYVHHLDIAPG